MADGGESLVRDGDDHEDGSHVSDRGEGPQEVREERDVRPRGQVEVLPEQSFIILGRLGSDPEGGKTA